MTIQPQFAGRFTIDNYHNASFRHDNAEAVRVVQEALPDVDVKATHHSNLFEKMSDVRKVTIEVADEHDAVVFKTLNEKAIAYSYKPSASASAAPSLDEVVEKATRGLEAGKRLFKSLRDKGDK